MMDTRVGGVEEPVSLTAGADLLDRLATVATSRERVLVDLVETLAQANRAGVTEALEGLPLEAHLSDAFGWNRAEISMLLDAGDVLAAMPATTMLWRRGVLSWSVIRDLVGRVRSLGREGRGLIDTRLGASAALLADMDADRIGWAIADAVDAVRGATVKERQEQASQKASFVAFQLDFEGGSRVYGELDALGTAVVTGALDSRADQDDQAGSPQSEPADRRGGRRSRAQRRAAALTGICADSLGGYQADPESCPEAEVDRWTDSEGHPADPTDGRAPTGGSPSSTGGASADDCAPDDDLETAGGSAPSDDRVPTNGPGPTDDRAPAVPRRASPNRPGPNRPAKPLVIVHVPLDRITETAAGLLEVAVPGSLPTLSARLVDIMAADADIRAVLFDGKRPLMVTRKLNAKTVPADTRMAVQARDLGARDPAGRTPVPLSDIHHLTPGIHDPDRLIVASPAGHLRIIHRHGWSGTLDPTTAALTWTRNGRTIRTLPWGTPLNHAPAVPPREVVRPPERAPLPDPPD